MDDNELAETLKQLQLKHGLLLSNTETELAIELALVARAAERERCAKLCESKAQEVLRAGIPLSGPLRTLEREIRGA